MRRPIITMIVLLLLAGLCEAQDRTRTRLAPKPATQEEVQSLRDAVAELSREVESLKAQVADLAQSVASAQPSNDPKNRVAQPVSGKEMAIGMTLAQVQRLTQKDGTLIEQDGSAQRYKWVVSNSRQVIKGNVSPSGGLGTYTLWVDFEDGKVTRFRQVDNHDSMNH